MEIPQVSPLEASTTYLRHLRDAWNGLHPFADLADQEVTVTVPASFDPAARELTAEAARAVGIENLVLLEEPQAALYNWVNDSKGTWRKQVRVGDIILVVDVGGGTTDLSLIAVTEREGALELTRVAVGEHILLGGDNMDLALAHVVKGKLGRIGVELDRWQIQALTHGCRHAKERILSEADLDAVPVVVPSRGAKLVGGSVRTELTRAEVTGTLIDGFFPEVPASARPAGRARTALTKLGLPFAQDPAVTRHLAAFLGRQTTATETLEGFVPQGEGRTFLHPTAVLFNGGVFKAEVLRDRVMHIIGQWLAAEGGAEARLLGAPDLDLSVAGARPTTATFAGSAGCASGAARPSPTTSGSRAPCPRSRALSRPCRPCAWPPSAWKRARTPRSPPRSSGWWWGNWCASASSAPRCGGRTVSAPCWRSGPPRSWKSWRNSRPNCPRGHPIRPGT